MKILHVNHKALEYEFRYLHRTHSVHVFKGGKLTYVIRPLGKLFRCNCPSGVYRGRCWHLETLPLLSEQKLNEEPWAKWAEEAEVMHLKNERR